MTYVCLMALPPKRKLVVLVIQRKSLASKNPFRAKDLFLFRLKLRCLMFFHILTCVKKPFMVYFSLLKTRLIIIISIITISINTISTMMKHKSSKTHGTCHRRLDCHHHLHHDYMILGYVHTWTTYTTFTKERLSTLATRRRLALDTRERLAAAFALTWNESRGCGLRIPWHEKHGKQIYIYIYEYRLEYGYKHMDIIRNI